MVSQKYCMNRRRWRILPVLVLGCALLGGCGKDFNGFGEFEGWGGYTRGFGDVDEGYKSVGLCSYTGGCTPPGKVAAPEGWGTTSSDSDK